MFPGEHTVHASISSLSDCFSNGVAILVVVSVAIIVVAVIVAMISVTVALIAAWNVCSPGNNLPKSC